MEKTALLKDPANGAVPPEIPHITGNVVNLERILKEFSFYAYQELSQLVNNLHLSNQSDNSKKKKFLDLLVKLRQDFVKIYVLIKWSVNSKYFGSFIDLLDWLRNQNNFFSFLIFNFKNLNSSLSNSKLPNPDLITALEVFLEGRPQLPSHNLLIVEKLSPEIILKSLKDLNVILSIKLALLDDLPPRFSNYTIKDGRVTFKVTKEFECSITTDNDSPDSAFYLIDFKFCFGIKDNLISDYNTYLPTDTFKYLEKLANQALAVKGLNGLYSLLHHYSITYKLYLIHKQLNILRTLHWKNAITHTYNSEKNIIIIKYWNTQPRSYIEIGINKNYDLSFRWFKNGKFTESDIKLDNESELNIEWLLQQICLKHSELIMLDIYNGLIEKCNISIELLGPYQLSIKFSNQKNAILSIDSVNGGFFFLNSNPITNKFLPGLNNNFNKQDISSVVINLIKLNLEINSIDLNNKLISTGWIYNDIIMLTSEEFNKLNVKLTDQHQEYQIYKISFYRRKFWPVGWFLINYTNGYNSEMIWFVSRIKSINNNWTIKWFESLKIEYISYDVIYNLANNSANKIISHLILSELKEMKIQFLLMNKDEMENVNELFSKIDKDLISGDEETKDSKDNTIVAIKNQELLPLSSCEDTLYLRINLKGLSLKITLFGKFRENNNIHFENFDNSNIKLDSEKRIFQVTEIVQTEETSQELLLNGLFANVNNLSKLILILNNLNKLNIQILSCNLNCIKFQYDDQVATIVLDEDMSSVSALNSHNKISSLIRLEIDDSNPHKFCESQLTQLLQSGGITPLIDVFTTTLPFVKAIQRIESETVATLSSAKNVISFRGVNLPKVIFKFTSKEVNFFNLIYNVNTVKDDNVIRDKIKYRVQLREKSNSQNKLFHISFKETSTQLTFLKSLFDKNGNLSNLKGLIIPLGNSIVCDSVAIHDLMLEVHEKTLGHFLGL